MADPNRDRVDSSARAAFAYVGSFTRQTEPARGSKETRGISVYAFDAESGDLSPVQTVASDNPSFLALHPGGRFLYAVNEIEDFDGRLVGSVESYARDTATGRLTLLNRQDSGSAGPTHLAVAPSGRHVVVANYVGGTFAVLPIRDDGRLDPVSFEVEQTGSGPNPERQAEPHPHGVAFDPAGRHVATADLGTDTVAIFRLDAESGRLEPTGEALVAPGAGPRHLAFLADGRSLLVVNELIATVTIFAYDAASGRLGPERQTVPTVSTGVTEQTHPAEIVVHPSGRFVYASNRARPGAGSPLADSVVGYAVDQASGRLGPIGHATEGIANPRQIALDPFGRWLYACNQGNDSVVRFHVDPTTGGLAPSGVPVAMPSPVCLVVAS